MKKPLTELKKARTKAILKYIKTQESFTTASLWRALSNELDIVAAETLRDCLGYLKRKGIIASIGKKPKSKFNWFKYVPVCERSKNKKGR